MRRSAALIIAISLGLCPGILTARRAASAAPPGPNTQAISDPSWDAAFTRTTGWTCGDIAHSIDLGDGRTLWLFGDSGIGPVAKQRHVRDRFTMVRSAVAVHSRPPRPGDPPADLQFAFGPPRDGHNASAWISPAPGLWPDGTWYWLMGDGALVPSANDGHAAPRLVLFATALGPSGNPDGMWNFRRIGGVVLTVANPADPPAQWRIEQRRNPLVQPIARHGEPPRAADDWGVCVLLWREAPDKPQLAYIFGVRTPASGPHGLLVARTDPQHLDHPRRWTFFDGRGWSTHASSAVPLATDLPDEFTVESLTRDGQSQLVLVQSEPLFGRRIFARTANRPQGPWTDPVAIFEVPYPARDNRLTTYAAKGHASLSRPGELLVSYIVNSRDFNQVLDDATLYRPNFIRVPLVALPSPPTSAPPHRAP